jgi:ribulose 1,5-bisphosphate synthetase/thiazole synthase
MAPMAIGESFTELTHSEINGTVEVEDVVIAGAGPAGLMLAYVKSGQLRTSHRTDTSSIARHWPVMA